MVELKVLVVGVVCFVFFFNDTATTEIYTLSLHDALPIWLTALAQVLRSRFPNCLDMHLFENPYQPDWYWLTLQDAQATKANGIRELQMLRGLQNHDLTVFGDHNNDISMFQLADVAVATANATPELRQHATEIIGHHSEDSVVKYLETRWSMVNV